MIVRIECKLRSEIRLKINSVHLYSEGYVVQRGRLYKCCLGNKCGGRGKKVISTKWAQARTMKGAKESENEGERGERGEIIPLIRGEKEGRGGERMGGPRADIGFKIL